MKKVWSKEPYSMLDRECAEYFREHPVFDRLLLGFREKYASYGTFSGTVTLRNIRKDEVEGLEGFFQRNYHGQKSVSITAARFLKALENSRFNGVDPKAVLELYFQEEMTGKKEQREEETKKWGQTFSELLDICKDTPAQEWARQMQQTREEGFTYFMKRYRESGGNMKDVWQELLLGVRILNGLPFRQESTEYLAVFASMITGNPHAFDDGTKGGQLLNLLIQWCVKQQGIPMERSGIFQTTQKQQLYLAAGILRDDISNYAMISGIRAWKKNGEIHSGMEGFWKEGEMVHVPLSVLTKWKKVECPDQTIYIVENTSVYAMLCREWKGRKACMCMNGQPRLSGLLLLDLLAEAGVKVYYAGDFDPEGLLIAQKLKAYYKDQLFYWHMSVADYEKSKSKEPITEQRMHMLERITDTQLEETAAAVRKGKTAGYQENIWEDYVKGL